MNQNKYYIDVIKYPEKFGATIRIARSIIKPDDTKTEWQALHITAMTWDDHYAGNKVLPTLPDIDDQLLEELASSLIRAGYGRNELDRPSTVMRQLVQCLTGRVPKEIL